MNAFDNDFSKASVAKNKYHIRVQQRNGRKCITTLQGLEDDLDTKRICRAMRTAFNCNGNVIHDEDNGDVIQLQGDQRENIRDWILAQQILSKNEEDRIVIHGY